MRVLLLLILLGITLPVVARPPLKTIVSTIFLFRQRVDVRPYAGKPYRGWRPACG